jgi:putative endonuclease
VTQSRDAWWRLTTKERGDAAERVARAHLEASRYRVLQTNFRAKSGELDLICRKEGVLVFVEVRSATEPCFVDPLESLSWRKRHHLRRTARCYGSESQVCRFDLVVVRMRRDGSVSSVETLEDVLDTG